jgi:hypothetical protein
LTISYLLAVGSPELNMQFVLGTRNNLGLGTDDVCNDVLKLFDFSLKVSTWNKL